MRRSLHIPTPGPTTRADRAAANRETLRRANERVGRTAVARIANTLLTVRCECVAPGCPATFEIHSRAYAALADDDRRYAVAPGHADASRERVAAEFPRYQRVDASAAAPTERSALRPRESHARTEAGEQVA